MPAEQHQPARRTPPPDEEHPHADPNRTPAATLNRERFDGVIFDLDGVVTQTARVHAAAWKRLFDEYRDERQQRREPDFEAFDIKHDYPRYLDGRSRYDGIQAFLEARGIELPYGQPNDPPGRETVCSLANRKNVLFREQLERTGVQVYDSTVRLIRQLREGGFKVAVISASRNCEAVLAAAGIQTLFDARVDGVETARLNLKGKPAPDVFVEAAKRLGLEPTRAAVVEDAAPGVEAGRRGGFGFVIGVDRTGNPGRLRDHGAHLVVSDLAELAAGSGNPAAASTADLPSAVNRVEEILAPGNKTPAVFLDYDGTLTPIVARPEDAVLSPEMREIVRRLAGTCTVAVVSGRDTADVRNRVGLEELYYAGSHGFEIVGPHNLHREQPEAQACLPELGQAESSLRTRLASITGAQIERKRFSVAIHFRNVDAARAAEVERAVDEVAAEQPRLRKGHGKKVFELQPCIDWHKGRAVLWLLEALGLNKPEVLPLYLGDDLTDEDAFRSLHGRGVGIVVREQPRRTSARYALDSTAEVGAFLARLTERSGL